MMKGVFTSRRILPSSLYSSSLAGLVSRVVAGRSDEGTLDRIAAFDPKFMSYATVIADSASAQTKWGAEISRGKVRWPLHGHRIAVKDPCRTSNAPTARDMAPLEDATVVRRLAGTRAVVRGTLPTTEGGLLGPPFGHQAAGQTVGCFGVAQRVVEPVGPRDRGGPLLRPVGV